MLTPRQPDDQGGFIPDGQGVALGTNDQGGFIPDGQRRLALNEINHTGFALYRYEGLLSSLRLLKASSAPCCSGSLLIDPKALGDDVGAEEEGGAGGG